MTFNLLPAAKEQITELEKRETAMRKTLEFYAEPNNYHYTLSPFSTKPIEDDFGAKARAVLKVK